MGTVSELKIELLRKGPPHNQLLSPLTEYIALCGEYAASTIHLPYEHRDFLDQLDALRYEDKARRKVVLTRTANDMAGILSQIPGLVSEMVKAQHAHRGLTNLRLVVSASELALLPFELATVPDDAPGAGMHLLLQTQVPLTLTREVRHLGPLDIDWTRPPRILFASASPPGVGRVPLAEHLRALRAAIDPWVRPYAPDDKAGRAREVGKLLTVLPEASIQSIREACADGGYTHVHLLAHGAAMDIAKEEQFGMALHDRNDLAKADVVDGARLASALLANRSSSPTVVTVAACDSGQVGSVIVQGASLAHNLHLAGIPVVVASQFPLSFEGSEYMTRVLYSQMLRGEDPREALYELRRQLYDQKATTHDWASIVTYADLPSDFENQLHRYHYQQALAAAKNAIKQAQWLIDKGSAQRNEEGFERAIERLDKALEDLPDLADDLAESTGMRGSLEKQKAELLYHAAQHSDEAEARQLLDRQDQAFKKALRHYRNAFFDNLSSHWTGIQYLVLSAVVDETVPYDLWTVVRVAADRAKEDKSDKIWASGTLAELYMLGMLLEKNTLSKEEATEKTMEYANRILNLVDTDSFEVFSTWRQFKRYLDWWTHLDALRPIARKVVDMMEPDDPNRYV